ncbi:EF-hand domain-containing protein [Aquabacterium sp.]|uniref:EF-hand domain-containing protein n=1 Tax=Aquabacterium sp. TaxID=1872578 RepID=UPI0025C22EB8|nr:EF-hand domain-containing protein [Aquabacterium sp.]
MTTISSGISGSSSWGGMQPPKMEGRGGKPSFSKIDTDGSGGLDKTELQSMLDKGPQGVQGSGSTDDLFSKLDSDGDGSISQSELDTGMKPPSRDDSTQNGFGSMGMDTQAFAAMMGGSMGGSMGGMNGMGGMPPPPPPSGDDSGGFSLSALDSDQDGSITKSEFGLSSTSSSNSTSSTSSSTSSTDEAQQALFDLIDSDKSGDISKTEVSSFQDKMKALFEKMQQMGTQQFSSETSSLSVTA